MSDFWGVPSDDTETMSSALVGVHNKLTVSV